jgi:hypothetical protein
MKETKKRKEGMNKEMKTKQKIKTYKQEENKQREKE